MADTTERSASASSAPAGRDGPERKPSRATFRSWLTALFGIGGGDHTLRDSLEEMIEEHDDTRRSLTEEERHMLINILSFGELRVDDVMVPRADVVAVEEGAALEELFHLYSQSSHSRMPIYRETLDDPIGMVHIKDVMAYLAAPYADAAKEDGKTADTDHGAILSRNNFSLRDIRRNVLFVPPSMPALDLLLKMQATHIHMALVIDEYGGTDGLVSIEDLVEEIVGEIEDEHDIETGPTLTKRPDGTIDADARCEVEELEDMLGLKLTEEEEETDVDTLGGLVFSLVGRVPLRGELISHPAGIEFEVKDADPRRIKKLRIHLASRRAAGAEAGEAPVKAQSGKTEAGKTETASSPAGPGTPRQEG